MSVKLLLLLAICCLSSFNSAAHDLNSTKQVNETTERLHQQANSTSTTVSSEPQWLRKAIKDIAYYLRAHKFKEYDRRYERNSESARKGYYGGFPKPPLRSLHWEVHKFCEESFIVCLDYVRKRVSGTELQRRDDTNVVIMEQNWNPLNDSQQIEILDKECKRMLDLDELRAEPFEGPIERFQWRTTASYFMCWYTLQSEPALEHLQDNCDNFARCLDPTFGVHNGDPRANDAIPYACALYSFCPDPCCPIKHLPDLDACWNNPDNPCYEPSPIGHQECILERSLNTDFRDLVLNRWNVTCSCPQKGFHWSSRYGICVDTNECTQGTHTCDLKTEECLNLPGKFTCVCKWGHVHDQRKGKCTPSAALILLRAEHSKSDQKGRKSEKGSFLEGIRRLLHGSQQASGTKRARKIDFKSLIIIVGAAVMVLGD